MQMPGHDAANSGYKERANWEISSSFCLTRYTFQEGSSPVSIYKIHRINRKDNGIGILDSDRRSRETKDFPFESSSSLSELR